MTSELQRDIEAVERVLMQAFRLDSDVDAWLRLKVRLTPDREAEEVNRNLLQSLTDIYVWTEHKDTAWAKRAKGAIDNATRLDR